MRVNDVISNLVPEISILKDFLNFAGKSSSSLSKTNLNYFIDQDGAFVTQGFFFVWFEFVFFFKKISFFQKNNERISFYF